MQKNFLSILGSTSLDFLNNSDAISPGSNPLELKNNLFINGLLSNGNPLFESYCYSDDNTSLFLQGFFYRQIEINNFRYLLKLQSDAAIDNFFNSLNGAFIGIISNKGKKEIKIITDLFSFEKIFYTVTNGHFNFSSFLWPLIRLGPKPVINNEALIDILTFGFPLGSNTILENINVCEPGSVTTFSTECKKINSRIYTTFQKARLNHSIKQCKLDFTDISKSHFDYIKLKFGNANFGTTLTGGNDTRVVLNSLLNYGIQPFCISGYNLTESNDSLRSAKICRHYNLSFKAINYSTGINEIIDDVIDLSNGYTNGTWMANIMKNAKTHADVMYFGFSGDYLAGGNEFIYEKLKIDEIVELSLISKSFYKLLHPGFLVKLLGQDSHRLVQRYYQTFEPFKNLPVEDMVFMQEKNQKNFKRTSSFADGTRIGMPTVFFFHDREIVDFYRSINPRLYRQQLLHHKLMANRLPFLGWIPSANKTELPAFTIPYVSSLLPENFLLRVYRILKPLKTTIYFNSKSELLSYINDEKSYRLEVNINDYFDLDSLYLYSRKTGFTENDIVLLKMRMHDIILCIDRINKTYKN
jgi:hypothetical protein